VAARTKGSCTVRKRISFAPFYTKNDHFTKTDSGQTWGKLKIRGRFL
jgi:hypothetical protein